MKADATPGGRLRGPFPGLHFRNIRGDIFGGVTAAVVALPLMLAFGLASGAGPVAGLYGAIFVGFFAALFGGTPSQISGPTGPMTVVMAFVVAKYAHDPALAFTVVVMGGAFQILFGVIRLGNFITLVPFPVISGFISGVGCIIAVGQVAPLLGHARSGVNVLSRLQALPGDIASANVEAVAIGLLALAIMWLTPRRIGRVLPAPLIALLAGTVVAWLFLPGAPVLGHIPTGFPEPRLPAWSWPLLPDMIISALVLALLASVDSLITSLVADSVTHTNHDSDRELIGQGIGNLIAGLFGALPGAGATGRTVVNIRAGGKTSLSGMIYAASLLAVALGLGPLAALIPHAVLAGILIKVAVDLIDWSYLRRVPRAPRAGVVIMFGVLGLTVFVDPIVAVAVGTVAASLLFVKRMSDLQIENLRMTGISFGAPALTNAEKTAMDRESGKIMLCQLGGPLSFGAAKGLHRRLVVGDEYKALVLDLTEVNFIDTSASLALENIIVKAGARGLEVLVAGIQPGVEKILRDLGVFAVIPATSRFATRVEALKRAAELARQPRDAA